MEKRIAYLKKIEDNLAKYNIKLDEMKDKVLEVQADMKSEYLSQISHLEEKREDFLIKYGKLKETSEHGWEDVKVGTEKAWNELESSIEKAISRFK